MQAEPQPIRLSTQGKLIAVAFIISLAILLLSSIGQVLPPFIAAIITAYLFNPLIALLERHTRIGRPFWIMVLYVIIFSLFYGLATWVWPRIMQQYEDLVTRLPDIANTVAATFESNRTINMGPRLRIDLAPLRDQIISALSDLGRTLSESVPHLVFTALESMIYALVYLIVTFYLLYQSQELKQWVVGLIPLPYRAEICGLGRQIDGVLNAFIRGQLLLIVIMAVLIYIPLSILRVPYALVIAIASGVLELIPILGPWSAAIIAMIVALFQPDVPFGLSHVGLAGLIGVIYFTLRQIEDSFIIPNVMGHLVRLHPAVVLFAVLAGGALGGAFGLFLAIPAAAVLRILLGYLFSKLTDSDDGGPRNSDPRPELHEVRTEGREPRLGCLGLRPEGGELRSEGLK